VSECLQLLFHLTYFSWTMLDLMFSWQWLWRHLFSANLMLCSWVTVNWCFTGMYCLHLWGQVVSHKASKEQAENRAAYLLGLFFIYTFTDFTASHTRRQYSPCWIICHISNQDPTLFYMLRYTWLNKTSSCVYLLGMCENDFFSLR
jgi:hypothetical protein